MATAASNSSIATRATQDPPRILVFIPSFICALQPPCVIAQFTRESQWLLACAGHAA